MTKRAVIVVTVFLFAFSATVYAEKYPKNYIVKIGQLTQGWESGSKKLAETIKSVKTGKLKGKDVMKANFFISLEDNLRDILLLQLPEKKTKSLENADNVVTLQENSSWCEFHRSVIRAGVYYLVAQKLTRKGFSDCDIKSLDSALKLIELGDRSYDRLMTLVNIEEKE